MGATVVIAALRTGNCQTLPSTAGNGPSISARRRDSSTAAAVIRSITSSHQARPSSESYGRPSISMASWTPMTPRPIFRVRLVASSICGIG